MLAPQHKCVWLKSTTISGGGIGRPAGGDGIGRPATGEGRSAGLRPDGGGTNRRFDFDRLQ